MVYKIKQNVKKSSDNDVKHLMMLNNLLYKTPKKVEKKKNNKQLQSSNIYIWQIIYVLIVLQRQSDYNNHTNL